MASLNLFPFLFLLPLLVYSQPNTQVDPMYPFACSGQIKTCNATLYQNNNLSRERIASLYSVDLSQIIPIRHNKKTDHLVTVPCSCKDVSGTVGYFYDTHYKVQLNDTFVDVTGEFYSGQAWQVGDEERTYKPDKEVDIHLLCGCIQSESEIVVTYTVQLHDTLSDIANILSARMSKIESLNKAMTKNPEYIDVGWVFYIPMVKNGIPGPEKGMSNKWTIIIGILSVVTLLSMCTLAIIVIRKNRSQKASEENPKAVTKNMSAHKSFSLQNYRERMEDITGFESERPVIYSLEEIAEATNNFEESRKIGEGGYGSVYFGVLGGQEVAVKKMRANKCKEFFAELKVLCKIHHINVVELIGYASGDDHLYLIYEYISNGSLNEHLHDPLLKGHQPLSWTARSQVALDTAKGIEYIHDHTKARYVHRDIKTSNILLDEGLRAKVADFGLAKLVGRTNEDDFIATRLVGTPGYLPPESVKELQVTTKTDVFAFGVVLAELITGQRALIRDHQEPNKLKSLITIINKVFRDEEPEIALESIIDTNLKGNYPMEDVYKMAEIADWCLSEDPFNRPEMQEIVVALSKIVMSSIEWEASLGGNSQVFSGVFNGR